MPGKRVRRRDGDGSDGSVRAGVPDLEAVLDELYGTPPSGFVARREMWAAAARTSGRGDDARLIQRARRPTLAAWAANLLLRSRPEECGQFLELGESLREAYRVLDADGLKALSDQRRRVVAALSREAAGLAREAGQPLSASVLQEVESTLRAVLADADAAERWAEGRLKTALAPPSAFSSDAAPAAVASDAAPAAASAKGKRPGPSKTARPAPVEPPTQGRTRKDELAGRRRERQLRLEREQRLAAAREAAEAAERRLRDRRSEAEDADASLRRTRDHRDLARRQVAAAERQLHKAREDLERAEEHAGRAEEELDRAEQEQRQAEQRLRAAADALTEAERAARDTAQAVRRLTRSHGD